MNRPLISIQQACRDWKAGRYIRKQARRVTDKPEDDTTTSEKPTPTAANTKGQQQQQQPEQNTTSTTASFEKQAVPATWHCNQDPHAEFPWRLEFVIDEECSWQGTWRLEVSSQKTLGWAACKLSKIN